MTSLISQIQRWFPKCTPYPTSNGLTHFCVASSISGGTVFGGVSSGCGNGNCAIGIVMALPLFPFRCECCNMPLPLLGAAMSGKSSKSIKSAGSSPPTALCWPLRGGNGGAAVARGIAG